jgi:hypothetical protein
MKLTAAQAEICATRQFRGADLKGTNLTITDLTTFRLDLLAAVEEVSARPYHPTTARELFATKYLLTKFDGEMLGKETNTPTEITLGATVYLKADREQTFKVIGQNRDGSWSLYGGLPQFQMYRNLHTARLTTRRKK